MLLAVRHHSPACARMVRDTIAQLSPAAVLIEGPADFNERITELTALPHRPPIAIYSYLAWEDGSRHGAYYPLCEHSPEWQALRAAAHVGAEVRFIDLPLALMARQDPRTHRYGDDRLRSSDYVTALCRNLGVESFDDAWDLIAEVDPDLTVAQLRTRVADYCRCLREADEGRVSPSDLSRERYMAAHIRAAWEEYGRERVLVVTGGYHTSALERLLAQDEPGAEDPGTQVSWPPGITERGIALTPYSYERLDSLANYDAGMPSPGFYHEAWRATKGSEVHLPLLTAVIKRLRELKQAASTADLIGIEACARGLAELRGHRRVWRNDLTDGITSALVKDDVHLAHPFILAMQQVLRGGERGQLAEGSPLPPLVLDIYRRLAAQDLTPGPEPHTRQLTLTNSAEMPVSRLLHQLRVLQIPGFAKVAGADFAARADLSALTEEWEAVWTPEQDAQMIEASRYGSAVHEAAAARLAEAARSIERNAAAIALLLLDAVLAGVLTMAETLRAWAVAVIDADGDLGSIAAAMDHLLYLYAWDDAFGVRGSMETGNLLAAAFGRALWLLDAGATAHDTDPLSGANPHLSKMGDVDAVRLLRDAFEKARERMSLDREALCAVLARVQADRQRGAPLRGACAGALWSLQSADPAAIRADLMEFVDGQALGDFLGGLFALAREEAQGDAALLAAVRAAVAAWDADSFLSSLPALRLAFMYFTAREKVYLARTLFEKDDAQGAGEPAPLTVSTNQAVDAMAFERQLAKLAGEYGVRIGSMDNEDSP